MDRRLGRQAHRQLVVALVAGAVAGVAASGLAQTGYQYFAGRVEIASTDAKALDVAGGAEFGSGNVALIGTDGRLAANSVGASAIAANAVGTSELRTATGSATGSNDQTITMHDYSFFPSIRISDSNSCSTRDQTRLVPTTSTSTNTVGRFTVVTSNVCTVDVAWRYMTSSDTPSVWAVVAADGTVVALWESEDPVSADDTEAPLATDEATHTVVNMGVPSLAVITTLANALTADQ